MTTKTAPAPQATKPVMSGMLRTFFNARRISTPLVAINTPDPAATSESIMENLPGSAPIVQWDIVRAMIGLNDSGKRAATDAIGDADPIAATRILADALDVARRLPKDTVMFVLNAQHFLEAGSDTFDPSTAQGVWNLRDPFKSDGRMLVLLGPDLLLPTQLEQDVLVMDEPLPTQDQLKAIVLNEYEQANFDPPPPETVVRAVDALCGIAAFSSSQAMAMSITKGPDKNNRVPILDMDGLWERKRRMVEQTKGLSISRDPLTFADLGDLENLKQYLTDIFTNGPEEARPRSVVFWDEMEKMFAGVGTDTSGTATKQLGQTLTYMSTYKVPGIILVGPPGVGKSAIASAAGNEGKVPTIICDATAMEDSLVGSSAKNLRQALKIITAVSSGKPLFIATCNDMNGLPLPLQRRFSLGTFYVPFPSNSAKPQIWEIYLKKYGLENAQRPDDNNWTGDEIRRCCDLAWRLRISLKDAAQYIVPVSISGKKDIEKLAQSADRKYLNASAPGGIFRYTPPAETQTSSRSRKVEE